MVRWNQCISGHEFEQTLGNSGGQRRLACCMPWGHKELDMTRQMNSNSSSQPTQKGFKELFCRALRVLDTAYHSVICHDRALSSSLHWHADL